MFADDCVVLITAEDLLTLIHILQEFTIIKSNIK